MKTNPIKRKSSSSNMIRESSQKKREAASGTSSSVCRDRISELPDEILHHVLSFLTTKSAMRTSVLSKRWRRVWACCPVLRLDQREFSSASKFASFVEGVRTLHGGLNLQRLVLSWQQGFDVLKVEALVKHAMMRRLKEIWVESPAGRGGRVLPGFLFHGGARVFIYSSLST